MTNLPLRWLIQLLVTRILVASAQPSCTVLPFITAVTSTIPQPGDQVLLYCNYTGAQGVSWTKGTMIISPTLSSNPCSCVSSAIDNSNSSLAINVTYGDDYDSYTCSVQVDFGTSCIASIVVQRPIPPVLTAVGSSSQTASQGSAVTFSVSLTTPGLPLASVVWTKNGVPLYNTTNMVVTSTMLQLSNIQPGDRGQYVATATNKAGSSAATFNLLESFRPVVNMSVTTSGSQATILCEAYGYPILTEVNILGGISPATTISNISPRDNFTSWGRASSTRTFTCPTTFHCTATNAVETVSLGTVIPCSAVLTFKPVGSNGVFIQWTPASPVAMVYTVQYRVSGSSAYTMATPILCGTLPCNTTVIGLVPGATYSFTVGSFPEQQVVVNPGLAPVTGVVALTTSNGIVVSWNMVPMATGYLVLVSQGNNSSFIQNVTMATNTTLVAGLTCGVLYTFTLQAYNTLNFSAPSPPNGIQATSYCSTSPGILTATADGTVVMVTFINVNSVMSVEVTATSDGGMVYYYNLPSPVGLCLSGLSPNTMFTICATFTLAAGTSEGDCYFQKVQTGTGTSGQLCSAVVTMSPSGTIAGPTSDTVGVKPWVIGVLVVGLLGLVAAVFCVMGMYLACRPDKTDQVNFGSSLSLEISPNSSNHTNDPSFKTAKSVSPPRSCLSRSTRSHTITWKDQMDTIRQLETNGTNV